MLTETLTWHEADTSKPDSDITMLLWSDEDGYFCGWWDDGTAQWHDAASGGEAQGVTHWAEPRGPRS